jgi:hypothetical protein
MNVTHAVIRLPFVLIDVYFEQRGFINKCIIELKLKNKIFEGSVNTVLWLQYALSKSLVDILSFWFRHQLF